MATTLSVADSYTNPRASTPDDARNGMTDGTVMSHWAISASVSASTWRRFKGRRLEIDPDSSDWPTDMSSRLPSPSKSTDRATLS